MDKPFSRIILLIVGAAFAFAAVYAWLAFSLILGEPGWPLT